MQLALRTMFEGASGCAHACAEFDDAKCPKCSFDDAGVSGAQGKYLRGAIHHPVATDNAESLHEGRIMWSFNDLGFIATK